MQGKVKTQGTFEEILHVSLLFQRDSSRFPPFSKQASKRKPCKAKQKQRELSKRFFTFPFFFKKSKQKENHAKQSGNRGNFRRDSSRFPSFSKKQAKENHARQSRSRGNEILHVSLLFQNKQAKENHARQSRSRGNFRRDSSCFPLFSLISKLCGGRGAGTPLTPLAFP